MPQTKPNYSLAAHLLHSGLQMIWKRLEINVNMDHVELMTKNIKLFNQVAKAMEQKYGVKSDRPDYGQAAYMLIETFHQSEPLYHWVIINIDHYNRKKIVTSPDGGETILDPDPKTRMTEEEATDIMRSIQERHLRESFYLEKRFYKDLPD